MYGMASGSYFQNGTPTGRSGNGVARSGSQLNNVQRVEEIICKFRETSSGV